MFIERSYYTACALLIAAVFVLLPASCGSARAAGNSPLKALKGASPDRKVKLLRDMKGRTGEKVLLAAAAHTRSSNEKVRKTAICVLGQHPNIEAAMYLINAAHRAEKSEERRLALRQAVRAVRNAEARNREKVDLYRSILFAADRPKEKKIALSGLGQVHSTGALALAATQMKKHGIAQTAARSALNITADGNPLDGPGVAQTLRRVTRVAGDQSLKKKAAEHLTRVAQEFGKQVSQYKQPQLDLLSRGDNLDGWMGATESFKAEDGTITCVGGGGDLLTKKEYSDFIFRFEFKLTPGSNSGIGVRLPKTDEYKQAPAYAGIELQVLHNKADKYSDLSSYQYHGSIYGVKAARRGALKPPGKWNTEEVIAIGPWITVRVNGKTIVHANLDELEPADGKAHPGLKRTKGHLGFLGHHSKVSFRDVRVLDLSGPMPPASPSRKPLNEPPEGYSALFNGEDLTGWKGLVADPIKRDKMDPVKLALACPHFMFHSL